MAKILGKETEAQQAQSHIEQMEQAIIEHGWDGNWFIRAYDDSGNKIGSNTCQEGKIFIESQGICSMAQIGSRLSYPEKALDSTGEHLATRYGIVLNFPAYTEYHLSLGEISSYPEGYKENGGIFCHTNPWIMIGEATLGRGDRAFDFYKRICPSYLNGLGELHKTEPYVYAQMIAGKQSANHGQAKNSWLTGTAAWNFVAISQYILGIRPDYNGLSIDPSIPRSWQSYTVKRHFRGAHYTINVSNPNGNTSGVKRLTVDGTPVTGNLVPVFSDGKDHTVEVLL